jgi:hypothetical protein
LGSLFAGMCAAILYGKVNRTQSHSSIMFSNAVCIQYEEEEDEIEDDEEVLRVKVRVNNIHLNSLSHIIFPTTFPLTSIYRYASATV